MKAPVVSTYAALRKQVEQTLVFGQERIEEAKVRTYWSTGRLINEYLRRAEAPNQEHGKKIVANLAKDLGLGEKVFYRCMQFAEKFPTFAARRKLSWAHYRALIAVPDEKKRLVLADWASKEEWTSRDLEIEIRNRLWDERVEALDGKAPSLLIVPTLGPFFTYKIIRPETIHSKSNELLIDLGFSAVFELNRISDHSYKPDTIVTSSKDARGNYSLKPSESRGTSPESLLFVYQAFVERVVDGDTLKVEIDLGFNIRIRQTIRLRAIDCPEMDTAEGKAAKKFVETLLKGVEYLTIKTVKPDKYDRYLGDVFIDSRLKTADQSPKKAQALSFPDASVGNLVYLNNKLIEKGYAVRVRE